MLYGRARERALPGWQILGRSDNTRESLADIMHPRKFLSFLRTSRRAQNIIVKVFTFADWWFDRQDYTANGCPHL